MRRGEPSDRVSPLAGHPLGARGAVDQSHHRSVGRGAGSRQRSCGACRSRGRGGRAPAGRRPGDGGTALGVGAGLYRSAAWQQPADADRRARLRPARGAARRHREVRRTPPDGRDGAADHPVDNSVGPDRPPDPERRRAGRRTRLRTEWIPVVTSTALNAARRNADLSALADGAPTDVVVIGGGITGVGIALDAASRGLRVALVEKQDLAFGTSRWSSKLVHGGLRYLATGNVGIARRSAVERGILMTRNAPHLVRAMPQLVPLLPSMSPPTRAMVRAGFLAGDVLRKTAGTPGSVLPGSQRISAQRALEMAPAVRRDGLDGGLLAYDGQLIDDGPLVAAIARTAAQRGARILTYTEASEATGGSLRLADTPRGGAL